MSQDNPDLGLVQTRWAFVNKDENLLTRLQNINLCFHFEVEQQVNGVFLNFFGFNGTAGIWRIKALEESGGWLERTTVEDMDIAVRAHLNGWKFIYLNDVRVSIVRFHIFVKCAYGPIYCYSDWHLLHRGFYFESSFANRTSFGSRTNCCSYCVANRSWILST